MIIDYITGKITEKRENGVVVEANGIGFFINVSNLTKANLPPTGNTITIYVYQYFKENEQEFYGFCSKEERNVFLDIISIPEIGPKIAMSLLSSASPPFLKKAVVENNVKFISSLPGIGKKTAEKIIFGLRDKIKKWAITAEEERLVEYTEINTVISALKALGYNISEYKDILGEVVRANPQNAKAEEIIRQVLQKIGKK
jgi:Holliday junction DNA helicase RuvA